MTRRAATTALLPLVLAAAVVLAGCSGSADAPAPAAASIPAPAAASSTPADTDPERPAVGPEYVALGDSYAAAPGVPETSGAGGCFRSSNNYAQLVAARTGLSVTDVTCSGATSDSVLAEQVPTITTEAELVTIGVGGNDFDLFTTLLRGCLEVASSDPQGSPCADRIQGEVDTTLPQISDNVGPLLDAIVAAAPQARVVVVGYPVLLPKTGTCPDLVPLAAGDYALVNQVTRALSDTLREQATSRGLDFLDLSGPSRGHDVCSPEPWVNGIQVAADGTIPFHPFAAEQRAVADLVAAFL